MVYRAARSDDGDDANKDTVELRFRDPTIFQTRLRDLSSSRNDNDDPTTITTQVAPAGDTTQRNPDDGSLKRGNNRGVTQQEDQRLSVSQLIPPKLCRRGAQTDDLLEISYVGRVVETGAIFDGSAIKINGDGVAGRGNDVSIFFVLGKQPFGTNKYLLTGWTEKFCRTFVPYPCILPVLTQLPPPQLNFQCCVLVSQDNFHPDGMLVWSVYVWGNGDD
jgi:hypothetical protein